MKLFQLILIIKNKINNIYLIFIIFVELNFKINYMEKKSYCEISNYNGECCCNCKNQIKLMKHPWNSGFGKGSIREQLGYVINQISINY